LSVFAVLGYLIAFLLGHIGELAHIKRDSRGIELCARLFSPLFRKARCPSKSCNCGSIPPPVPRPQKRSSLSREKMVATMPPTGALSTPPKPPPAQSSAGRYAKWITFGSLGALGAGLWLGLLAHETGHVRLRSALLFVEPLATIWLTLLQVIVFPLIVSVLVVSIASTDDAEQPGKMGVLTLGCFLSLMCLGAIFSLATASALVSGFRIDIHALAALHPNVGGGPAASNVTSAPWTWIRRLATTGLQRSVTTGYLVPLLAATVVIAIASRKLPKGPRARFLALFKAVRDATLLAVRWLFYALPVVVFILMSVLYSRTGSLIARGIGYYLVTVCGTLLAFTALQYVIVWFGGGVPVRLFARSLWAAQTAAATTRSSLASLPPLLDGALNGIGLPHSVSAFVLPLSVSTFKASQSLYPTFKLVFLAHLFGVSLHPSSLVAFVLGVFILSFTAPGVPSGGSLHTIPLLLALGIPMQGIILFNSVEAIPDVFETLLNVTADMTVAIVVNRLLGNATRTA
jgi:proton glutamate symport protein